MFVLHVHPGVVLVRRLVVAEETRHPFPRVHMHVSLHVVGREESLLADLTTELPLPVHDQVTPQTLDLLAAHGTRPLGHWHCGWTPSPVVTQSQAVLVAGWTLLPLPFHVQLGVQGQVGLAGEALATDLADVRVPGGFPCLVLVHVSLVQDQGTTPEEDLPTEVAGDTPVAHCLQGVSVDCTRILLLLLWNGQR